MVAEHPSPAQQLAGALGHNAPQVGRRPTREGRQLVDIWNSRNALGDLRPHGDDALICAAGKQDLTAMADVQSGQQLGLQIPDILLPSADLVDLLPRLVS